jgi:hypothetical protein
MEASHVKTGPAWIHNKERHKERERVRERDGEKEKERERACERIFMYSINAI